MHPTSGTTPSQAFDPSLSVALALHATPGGYALLLGSGMSRTAGIPTGWEVVQDLIRRVATLESAAGVAQGIVDPADWFRDRFGMEPSYSILLRQLARTPTERRELLRSYFEPTPDEREQGLKRPTAAHRAVARLMASGVVRVAITTNFDQLLETAIRDEGIVPAIISTVDAVRGMMPLHLSPATVIKLHGDYLDTRILNTPEELASYPSPLKRLLERVLDEYGLLVVGWSAAWDDALRAAITACPTRRFTTFWAARGPILEEARALIEHRGAQLVAIESADAFFASVEEKVAALKDLDQPHPLSTALAVTTLKQYLPVPKHRIRVHDLLYEEVERVIARVRNAMPTEAPSTWLEVVAVLPKLETVATTITTLMATAAFWSEEQHRGIIVGAIERLANASPSIGQRVGATGTLENLYLFPAQLAWYAAGICATATGSPGEALLADLLLLPHIPIDSGRNYEPPYYSLSAADILEGAGQSFLPGLANRLTPYSDFLFTHLREPLRHVLPDDGRYRASFDRLEYLISLLYAERRRALGGSVWAPVGRLAWTQFESPKSTIIEDITKEVATPGKSWFLIDRGAFASSIRNVEAAAKAVADIMLTIRNRSGR
jgi:hypothetical protein